VVTKYLKPKDVTQLVPQMSEWMIKKAESVTYRFKMFRKRRHDMFS